MDGSGHFDQNHQDSFFKKRCAIMHNNNFQKKEMIGNLGLVSGLSIALFAFLAGLPSLYFFSFILIITSIATLFWAILEDLQNESNSSYIPIATITIMLLLYFILRLNLLDFSLIVGDASDYLWSGVGSVVKESAHGFFLPLSSSVAGMGYEIFDLKHIPLMTTIIYSATLPILYFLLKVANLKPYMAIIFVLLFACLPLPIWFSKTTFSEPIWQVLLLLILTYSFKLLKTKKPSYGDFLPLFIIVGLAIFSRGSSIFLFGYITFLALYHFWVHQNTKVLLIFSVLLLYFDTLFAYVLYIRNQYLIGWQFSHIIPNITLGKMMALLLLGTAVLLLIFYILKRYQKKYIKFNFPLIITSFAIILKILVSYYFASKDDRFTFIDEFFLVQFNFATYHFGYFFALLIVIGVLYIYARAIKGKILFLLLIVFDALFSIPFIMMDVYSQKFHAIFLYWHRYYFSEIFIVHLFAIILTLGLIYKLIYVRLVNKKYTLPTFLVLILIPFLLTFDTNLFSTVTKNGYLTGASNFYEWISNKTRNKRLCILQDSTINFSDYNLESLTGAAFPRLGINVMGYKDIPLRPQKIVGDFADTEYDETLILCLSKKPCTFARNNVVLVDQYFTSLGWITHNSGKKITDIGAYLYRMEPIFIIGRKYNIDKTSKISRSFFLPDQGWHEITPEWIWSSRKARLYIPPLDTCKTRECILEISFGVFDASQKNSKNVIFEIDHVQVDNIYVKSDHNIIKTICLPRDSNGSGIFVDIKIPDAVSPQELQHSVDDRILGIKLKSLTVKPAQIQKEP